ncbi:hypothetical protein [Spiroplasma endosymbiont of Virgichneumon dumeticola]|uniref:SLAC1 family transporter n=1 Tax=Spiroplasma endosymbiont of Virgichneumon dumeticola TaxID=3139323 RepID=UPI0035C89ADA
MKNTLIKIQKKLLHIPLALTAVALGLTTLGIAFTQYNKATVGNLPGISFDGDWVQYVTIALASFFLFLCLLKVLSNPQWFWKEMKSGSASSHLPVLFMITMAIGEFVIGKVTIYGGLFYFGITLWYIGLICQLVYLVWWLVTRAMWFDIKDVDGAWYVPVVGIPVACAILPGQLGGANYVTLLQALWYFSFVGFIILTCLILYRYLFVTPIHTTELPAIGIIAAPASLLLVTYFFDFSGTKNENHVFMFLLAGIAITFTFIAYISMIKVFATKFNTGFAAYSFPLAIGVVARIVFASWFAANYSISSNVLIFFKTEAFAELVISSFVMVYLLVGFTIHSITKIAVHHDKHQHLPKIVKYFG